PLLPSHSCSLFFPYTTLFRSDGPELPVQIRLGALLDGVGDLLHLRGALRRLQHLASQIGREDQRQQGDPEDDPERGVGERLELRDRKSTRLNSSHGSISYAVF